MKSLPYTCKTTFSPTLAAKCAATDLIEILWQADTRWHGSRMWLNLFEIHSLYAKVFWFSVKSVINLPKNCILHFANHPRGLPTSKCNCHKFICRTIIRHSHLFNAIYRSTKMKFSSKDLIEQSNGCARSFGYCRIITLPFSLCVCAP